MNNNAKSIQQNMLYNTIGSLIYYACQWALTIVVVRMSGYSDQGILAIATSVTASPAIIGLFNIRSYQVSDLQGKYSDDVYIRSRFLTNFLSVIVCVAMILINGYSAVKVAAILSYMSIKVLEAFADVYYGIEQKCKRLDLAGISLTIKGIGTIALFIAVYALTENLIAGILSITLLYIVVLFVYDRPNVARLSDEADTKGMQRAQSHTIRELLIECFPLAVVAFCNNLSVNIPKIILENQYGSEVMGIYSSVTSPTVVIQLAATTIFAPLVPPLTEAYQDKDRSRFGGIIRKFSLFVIALSALAFIASALLGKWILEILFGESIDPYVYLFVPTIVLAILIAINACLFSVCTLVREIKKQYIIAAVGILCSWVFSILCVSRFEMMGVVYATAISLLAQTVIQVLLIVRKVRK